MQYAQIPAFLNELLPTMASFRLSRPLRIGWLYRNRIGIVRGLDPITDSEMEAVTRKRPGRRRLIVDEEKIRENIHVPEYLEDVWDFPDGAFSLMSDSRKIGIGIKATDRCGIARLRWFKLRDATRFFRMAQSQIITAALRHAIPPEKYRDWRVLEP
jgi:hypothetical protein